MIADGINHRPGRLGPNVVLDVAKVREIFVSKDPAELLAAQNGVKPGMIFRIWNRTRWPEATADLERPESPAPSASPSAAEALFDSVQRRPEIEHATEPPLDSLTLRLSPSRRIALAEIRRVGEATRIVPLVAPADVEALVALARRRGDQVVFEGIAQAKEEACQAKN